VAGAGISTRADATLGDMTGVRWLGEGAAGGRLGIAGEGRTIRWSPDGARTELAAAPATLGAVAALGDAVFGAGYDGKLWWWRDPRAAPVGLPGHASYVLDVAAVPQRGWIASSGADGTVRLWDGEGRVVRVLHDHAGPVHRVAASPDGALLVAADGDGHVVVWRLDDGVAIARWSHRGFVHRLAFAPDGRAIASVSDDKLLQVWSGAAVRTFAGSPQSLTAAAFSPDGRWVAAGGLDGTVRVWELATGATRVLRGHRGAIRDVRFTDRGLLTAADDGEIRRWSPHAYAPPPVDPAALRGWLDALTDVQIADNQSVSSEVAR